MVLWDVQPLKSNGLGRHSPVVPIVFGYVFTPETLTAGSLWVIEKVILSINQVKTRQPSTMVELLFVVI